MTEASERTNVKPGSLPRLPTDAELQAAARAEIEKWIGEDLAALRQTDGKEREVLPRSGESVDRGPVHISVIAREAMFRLSVRAAVQEAIRYPLVRTGEREEIPYLTRILVFARDDGHCKRCGSTLDLELDHVIPWSAGGPDTSNNLRLLCHRCNEERSNFWLGDLPRIFPVTAVCDYCLREHPSPHGGDRYPLWRGCPVCLGEPYGFPDYYTPAWCGTCQSMAYVSDPGRLL